MSAVFTSTGTIPPGSTARTDLRSSVLSDSLWFRVPYPGILPGIYVHKCFSLENQCSTEAHTAKHIAILNTVDRFAFKDDLHFERQDL